MQKITFDKEGELSKQAQDDVIDILKKDNADNIDINFVDEPVHQMEYQTIKKMVWLNVTLSWIILCITGAVLVSLWTSDILIKMIAFLLIVFFGWMYWHHKWDKKVRKYI